MHQGLGMPQCFSLQSIFSFPAPAQSQHVSEGLPDTCSPKSYLFQVSWEGDSLKRLLQLICVFFGAEEFFVCFGYESSYCVLPVINGDICPFGLRAAVQSELYPLRDPNPHMKGLWKFRKLLGTPNKKAKLKPILCSLQMSTSRCQGESRRNH